MDIQKGLCKEEDCIGCGNCENVCRFHAITVEMDKEGFYKRSINKDKCKLCGKCYEVCPVMIRSNKRIRLKTPLYYIAQADNEVRRNSSSGGIFRLLSDNCLALGGYVAGAVWTENASVSHILSNRVEDIEKMQGSKYIQSYLGDVFVKIRDLLDDGQEVLFSGTPCQVSALHHFLRRDYDNLITVDLICHGVMSQKLLLKYLDEVSQGRRVIKISLRDKTVFGWHVSMQVLFENGEHIQEPDWSNIWFRFFLNNYALGIPCADNCTYNGKTRKRMSDITLGDFWGIHDYEDKEKYDDGLGTSVVEVHTEKGLAYLDHIRTKLINMDKVKSETAGKRNLLFDTAKADLSKRKKVFEAMERNYSLRETLEYMKEEHYEIGLVGLWGTCNYGGILTGWSLYHVLQDLGYSVQFIDMDGMDNVGNRNGITEQFIRQNCDVSVIYGDKLGLDKANDIYDRFLVGSDQCWRSGFVKRLGYHMFLDFVSADKKKISYATSFAVSEYEGDENEKEIIRKLLRRFDHVSVREEEAVYLCEKEFGVKAAHMADPVFLVKKEHFDQMISGLETDSSCENGYLLCYCLDYTKEMQDNCVHIAGIVSREYRFILGPDSTNHFNLHIPNRIYEGGDSKVPSVPRFVAAYANAEYIYTDSFHGMCLAIIYKKPFLVKLNKWRGESRFLSLLKKLNLQDRIVTDSKEITDKIVKKEIDWERVYQKLEEFKSLSLSWLKSSLEEAPKAGRNKCNGFELRLIRQLSSMYIENFNRNAREKRDHDNVLKARKKRIINFFAVHLKDHGNVAFRCGGFHTIQLISLLKDMLEEKDISVTGIIDTGRLNGALVNYRRILPGEVCMASDQIDAIILSSSKYLNEIRKESYGDIPVLDLYTIFSGEIKEGTAYYEL